MPIFGRAVVISDPAEIKQLFTTGADTVDNLDANLGRILGPGSLFALSGEDHRRVVALCRTYAHADIQLLRDVKAAVLDGVRAFETYEADVVELAGADLLTALRGAVDAVSLYYRRLADHTRGHGITAADDPVVEPIPPDRGLPGHGGPLG